MAKLKSVKLAHQRSVQWMLGVFCTGSPALNNILPRSPIAVMGRLCRNWRKSPSSSCRKMRGDNPNLHGIQRDDVITQLLQSTWLHLTKQEAVPWQHINLIQPYKHPEILISNRVAPYGTRFDTENVKRAHLLNKDVGSETVVLDLDK